jgi:hypothetical protein
MTHREIAELVAQRGGRCDCCNAPFKNPRSAVLAHSRNGGENPIVCRICKSALDAIGRHNCLAAMVNIVGFLKRQIEEGQMVSR